MSSGKDGLARAAQRETVAFRVLGKFATLCRSRLGLGLGGPWVTQGSPKRDARATLARNGTSALFAIRDEKRPGGGVWNRVIADIAGDREEQISPRINPDGCGAGIKVKSEKS